MNRLSIFGLLATILCLCWLTSCTPEDYYYKDLIEGKDVVYPGKISGLSYSSGHNRFALDFTLSKDQQVSEVLIYWNNRADSVIIPVTNAEIGQAKQVIVEHVAEDTYDIEIFTRNTYMVRSIPTKITGRVYGDRYIASLNNRAFMQHGVSSGRVWIEWVPETRDDYLYTKVTYTSTTDQEIVVEQPRPTSGADWRYVDNYKRGTRIYYQAAYRPKEKTLDTYYSEINWIAVP